MWFVAVGQRERRESMKTVQSLHVSVSRMHICTSAYQESLCWLCVLNDNKDRSRPSAQFMPNFPLTQRTSLCATYAFRYYLCAHACEQGEEREQVREQVRVRAATICLESSPTLAATQKKVLQRHDQHNHRSNPGLRTPSFLLSLPSLLPTSAPA